MRVKVKKLTSMIIMIAMLVGVFTITGYAQEDISQTQKLLENPIDDDNSNKQFDKEEQDKPIEDELENENNQKTEEQQKTDTQIKEKQENNQTADIKNKEELENNQQQQLENNKQEQKEDDQIKDVNENGTKDEEVYQLNISQNINEGGVYVVTPPNHKNGYTAGTEVEIKAYSNVGYSVLGFDVLNKQDNNTNSIDDNYTLKIIMDLDKDVKVKFKEEDKVYGKSFYAYNGSFAKEKDDILGGNISVDVNEYTVKPGDTIDLKFTIKSNGEGYGDATVHQSNIHYDKLNEVNIGLANEDKLLLQEPLYRIGYEQEHIETVTIKIPDDASGTYTYRFDLVDLYCGEVAHIADSVEVTINVKTPIKITKKIQQIESDSIVSEGFRFGVLPNNSESEQLIYKIYTDYDSSLLNKLLYTGTSDEKGIVEFDIPIDEYIVFELPNPLEGYFNNMDNNYNNRKRYITKEDFANGEVIIEWENISHRKLAHAIINFKVQGQGIIKNEGTSVSRYIGDSNGATNYYYYNPQVVSLVSEASNGWSFDHWVIEEVEKQEENNEPEKEFLEELNASNNENNLTNKQLEFKLKRAKQYNITAVFRENYIPPTDPDPVIVDPIYYYKLTIESTEGGSVIPNGTKYYAKGTNVIMQIKPEEGYTFIGWEGDTDLLASETKVVVNKACKLKAVFEEKRTQPEEPEQIEYNVDEEEPDKEKEEKEEIEVSQEQQKEEVEILDEPIPVDSPQESPKTGGIPADIFYGFGSLLITSGAVLKIKKYRK